MLGTRYCGESYPAQGPPPQATTVIMVGAGAAFALTGGVGCMTWTALGPGTAVQSTVPAWWVSAGSSPDAPGSYYPGIGGWFEAGLEIGDAPVYPVNPP